MALFVSKEITMRILQINAVYATKSTGRSCKELHDWAVPKGHEVLTVYGNEPKANVPDTEAIYLGSRIEHKLHALSGRIAGDSGIGSWRATGKLLGIIRRYKPDVVHLRNLHGNFVHIPMLLRCLAKNDIPTVVQTDDCFWFTGGCMHYTVNGCYGWQSNCRNCHYLRRGRNYLIANRADVALRRKMKLFRSIPRLSAIGVSRWTAEQVGKSIALKKVPIIDYVYNWIDLDIFRPQGTEIDNATRSKLGLCNDDIMVLGVASGWGLNKGLDDFIRLRSILPANTVIFLVGNMAPSVQLPQGIIALGATESVTRLAEVYSAADVFVHLSREETFGKVTAEALACGTPAVVYDSTASPELVSPQTGAAVTPGDLEAVVEEISRLSALRPTEACRERAKALFSLNDNCTHQLDIYKKTIELSNTDK